MNKCKACGADLTNADKAHSDGVWCPVCGMWNKVLTEGS